MKRAIGAFDGLYKKLNAAQKEAVDAIEGPVMVVAGPGTGKTHVLTLRIANILKKTDTPADGVLALTFTEAAATNMRRRLAEIIGPAGYRVRIHTFHGYCQDVIARYPDEFPRIIGSDPITEIEKIDVLQQIILGNEWKYIKPFGDNLYYLNPIKGAISELKRENISVAEFSRFVEHERARFEAIPDRIYESGQYRGMMKGKYQSEHRMLERSAELREVYRAYEATLAERKKYDFEDMIVEVVSALGTNKALLLQLQEQSLYVLADEHQDANASQNKLLEYVCSFHDHPNLFVVGDEKQAIFRFQGASLENFSYFKRLYPSARRIALTESYRSGQRILDASHSLAKARADSSVVPVALTSKAKVLTASLEFRTFSTPEHERSWIAENIAVLVGEGVNPTDIAVLYRTNGEAVDIARAIEATGTSVSIESDQDALQDRDIRRLLSLLRAVARIGDDEALNAALHLNFVSVSPLDAYKVARHARRRNSAVVDVIGTQRELRKAGVHNAKSVLAFRKDIERWAELPGSVLDHIEVIMRESGFLAYALNSGRPIELLEKIAGFMRDVETLAAADPDYTLLALCDHVELLETHRVPVRKERFSKQSEGAVRLMTAHRAKGLEFEYVYIANVADGVWGGRRETGRFILPRGAAEGSDEDERRLLYVAITRAKIQVSISYSTKNQSGTERLPSRLLQDIQSSLIEQVPTEVFEKNDRPRANASKRTRVAKADKGYLRGLFEEQGLSVTALNNYLACPWQYFYSSLLRIPETPSKEMLFGTAAHNALKRFFERRARGSYQSENDLVVLYEEQVHKLPLSRETKKEVAQRGVKFLQGWFQANSNRWPADTKNEYRVQTELTVSMLPFPLILRGVLDRLDFLAEGVHVVDYKTGQSKSRNAIQGKTKSESGDYWRQLIFYRLLLEKEGTYVFKSAELDFLQPDQRGKYHHESFEISNEEMQELIAIITNVSKEIYNLSFWNKRCDRPGCRFCELRELMK